MPSIAKRIEPEEGACIACRLCEVHCLVAHSSSRHLIKAYREKPRPLPRVQVEEKGPTSLALQCRQCAEPLCVYACFTGAMNREPETGVVDVDLSRCVGCWSCIMVCPYGAIRQDLARQMVAKCDLCAGLKALACVENCPNRALVLGEAL